MEAATTDAGTDLGDQRPVRVAARDLSRRYGRATPRSTRFEASRCRSSRAS